MSENIEMSQDQALDQLKLQLALKELEKRHLLDSFMSEMGIKEEVNPDNIYKDEAFQKFMFDFSKTGPETIIQKFPDVWESVEQDVANQNLDEEFDAAGIKQDQVSEETLEFLKATKAFETKFPDSEQPTLKDRLWIAKDRIMEAASSPQGKVAVNAVMLGVALGTGSAGLMAGAKLAVAVSGLLLKNPAVAALAERVQTTLVTHLEKAGVPFDKIEQGLAVIKEKTAPVTEKPMFQKWGKPALLAGVALGAFMLNGSINFDSSTLDGAKEFGANALNKGADFASNIHIPSVGEIPGMASHAVDLAGDVAKDGLTSAKEGFASLHQFMDEHDPVAAVASRAHDSADGLREFADHVTGNAPDASGPVIASSDVPTVDHDLVAGTDPLPGQDWANNSFADGVEGNTPPLAPNEPPVVGLDGPTADAPQVSSEAAIPTPDDNAHITDRTDLSAAEKEALVALNEAGSHAAVEAATSGVHVIQDKDTVWGITKGLLGPGASNTDIANGVKAFIESNPHIAANPDLIFPGDKLSIPAGLGHAMGTPSVSVPQLADIKMGDLKLDDSGLKAFTPGAGVDVKFPTLEVTGADVPSQAAELASHFDNNALNALDPKIPEINFPGLAEIAPNASKFGEHLDNAAGAKLARDAAKASVDGPGMG